MATDRRTFEHQEEPVASWGLSLDGQTRDTVMKCLRARSETMSVSVERDAVSLGFRLTMMRGNHD